ncbi:phosphoribosyl-AMP cyclohydrolase [Kineococcus esterisolvens]|uniref:phosphoribosyl-AMP cyclohydrolase n=1 Tax=unclassified Kineococcus TaxID=2621656 RepID=UPI003D7D3D50
MRPVPVEPPAATPEATTVPAVPPAAQPPAVVLDPSVAARLKRDAAGLVCAVVQQHDTREVLMVAWMDDAALAHTLSTGRATYWSRSRRSLWRKGDTSGHVQWVKRVSLDCDGDALLVEVDQVGAACHTGDHTCFQATELFRATGPTGPSEPPAAGGSSS